MFPKIRAHERAHRDDPKAGRASGVEGGNHETLGKVPPAQSFRNLGVHERKGAVAALVREECRFAVDVDFELLGLAVVDYVIRFHSRSRRNRLRGSGLQRLPACLAKPGLRRLDGLPASSRL